MTDNPQTSALPTAGGEQKPGGNADKPKPSGDKTPSKKKRAALAILIIVAAASVAVPTLWAGYLSLQLLWAPVSLPRANDYEAALANVLELQGLAISEAKADPKAEAFFVSHVGCASPPVWDDVRVLENFERMRELGVEVKLLVGRKNNKGQTLPDPEWPYQFLAKLNKHGVSDTLHGMPRELRCHSVVAGSKRHAKAYITSHEEKNIYPTTYIIVRDNEACQQWKNYLVEEWKKHPALKMKIPPGKGDQTPS